MTNDDRIIRDLRLEMRWAGSDGTVAVPVAVLEHLIHRITLAEKGNEALTRYADHMARRYGLSQQGDM